MRYKYIAKDKNAAIVRGAEDAPNHEELINRLRAKGLFVVKVEEDGGGVGPSRDVGGGSGPMPRKGQRFTHYGIKLMDLALFAKQVATLLNSGVPLLKSLEIISCQSESKQFSVLLLKIRKDIESGLSFSEAVVRYPAAFSPLWKGLIQTGEASGNLGEVMDKLSAYLEERIAFMNKITTAMMYPAVLFFVAIGVVGFFIGFIMPKFKSIFDQFNMDLPLITKMLFLVATIIKNYFIIVAAVVVALGYALFQYFKTKEGRAVLDKTKLSAPMFKDFFITACLERFSSVMSILMHSGVPIIYSLEVTSSSVGNVHIAAMIDSVKDKVRAGKLLSDELNYFNFFPPLLVEMIHIGEEAGNLSEMFSKVAKHYQTELATKTERFTTMFEPLMIVFMGGIVGVIVLSIFLPLFKISTLGGSGGSGM